MYNLQAAILLSTGNKAKTRNKAGQTLIVCAYYERIELYWYVGWVDLSGEGGWCGCSGYFSQVEEFLEEHDVIKGGNYNSCIWLPVEAPFPEDKL